MAAWWIARQFSIKSRLTETHASRDGAGFFLSVATPGCGISPRLPDLSLAGSAVEIC